VLSRFASHPVLIFLDADVRLKSGAIARMTAFLEQSGAALASGVPEQVAHTFSERLLVPLIHFVLLGFLPDSTDANRPSASPGRRCLSLLRHAYVASGGHRAIRDSLHDGLKLPRVFRSAGFRTDLFDATDIASCRMFSTGAEVWRGLARKAGEGLGSPRLIGVASLLLAGGQILPLVSLAAASLNGSKFKLALSLAGTGAVFCHACWCPSISTARRRSAASSDCNLCALGDPVVCLFTLDGAPTRHLEGPRVFSGVHNVNIFFALFALVSLGVAVASPPEQLSDFALSDQNSVFRRNSFPKQKVTAMTVADRAGSEQLEPWIRSLYERYGSRIDIDGVADVSTVPKPLHGVVHALFRKRLTHSVMLDWHGSVVKRLEYEPGAANIYVIDRRGTILKQITGPVNAVSEQELFRIIDRAIANDRTR
jgi:glycosyl transferase family 21